jgi:signal transduction histidine kinase
MIVPFILSLTFAFSLKNRLLLSIIALALSLVSELFVTVMLSYVFSISSEMAMQGIFQIIGIVLSKLFLLAIIAVLRFRKYRALKDLTYKQLFALIAMPASSLIVSFAHVFLFTQTPSESATMSIANILSYLILIGSNVLVFQIIDTTYQNAEKEKQLFIAKELLNAQATQYEQMQEQSQQILKMKHDYKNFLLGLISELENENYSDSIDFLKDEYRKLTLYGEFTCMNNIALAVIRMKTQVAEERGISIQTNYRELEKLKISLIDLAIILGNALDNAIEATEKTNTAKKEIDVTINMKNDLVIITIRNPVENDVNTDHLVSSKRNDGSLGYGISSMRSIATKYHGEVLLLCKDKVFQTTIYMRNTNNE